MRARTFYLLPRCACPEKAINIKILSRAFEAHSFTKSILSNKFPSRFSQIYGQIVGGVGFSVAALSKYWLARSDRAINSCSAHYSCGSPPAARIQFQGSLVFQDADLRVVCFPEHFGARNLKSNQRPTLPHTALKQLTAPENYSRR